MRKRRQNDEIAKTHFQPSIGLCVCIQGFNEKLMQITQTSMWKYIPQFCWQVQFCLGRKCVFLALYQYITTAMNMIGGNLTEVSIVIFFFLFLCSSQSMKLDHWQIGDDIKIQALQIAKEWEIFRNIRLWCSGIIVETTKLLLNYF